MLLRPFAFPHAERLAVVWETMPQQDGSSAYMFASPPNFADWKARSTEIDALAAFSPRQFFLIGASETSRVWGAKVTASMFGILGVQPTLGRAFTSEDDKPGAEPVAILGHGLWRTQFGAAQDVLGRTVRLDEGVYTVIGVMPETFDFPPPIDLEGETAPQRNEIWVPLAMDMAAANRGAHSLRVIARLRPGATLDSASANLSQIAEDLGRQYPKTNGGWGVELVPFEKVVVGDARSALLVLLGAVGLVLLIACVNIANLMLVRSSVGRSQNGLPSRNVSALLPAR